MTRVTRLEFYTTHGCPLCDEAAALLSPVARRLAVTVETRDVLDDERWEAAYATRIPVVRRPDSQAELGWPFDAETLYRFCL